MPVGSASSQRFRDGGDLSTQSDTTKKAAPVDTVRLKKDMKDDMNNSAAINNVKELYSDSQDKADQAARSKLNDAQNTVENRARARGDTLDMARAGKIPVKKKP